MAVEQIKTETQRLGGSLTIPGGRGDVDHQQLVLLEAIAEALAAIGVPEGSSEPAEAVEAGISVEDKPAPRKRGKP